MLERLIPVPLIANVVLQYCKIYFYVDSRSFCRTVLFYYHHSEVLNTFLLLNDACNVPGKFLLIFVFLFTATLRPLIVLCCLAELLPSSLYSTSTFIEHKAISANLALSGWWPALPGYGPICYNPIAAMWPGLTEHLYGTGVCE